MANVMLESLDVCLFVYFCMSPDVPAFKVRILQVTLHFELK